LVIIGILLAVLIASFPYAKEGILMKWFPSVFPEGYASIDKALGLVFYIALPLVIGLFIWLIIVIVKGKEDEPSPETRAINKLSSKIDTLIDNNEKIISEITALKDDIKAKEDKGGEG